jgi:ATP-dependent Clp protease adaptor protein ClpS
MAFATPAALTRASSLQASPLRRARSTCSRTTPPAMTAVVTAAATMTTSRPRAALLEAPVKKDVSVLERMFAAPSADIDAKPDPGKKGKVMLLNDASNERSYVTRVLMAVCPELGPDLAWKIMMQAHKNGSAVVGIYPMEQAELIVEQLRNNGLGSEVVEA